MRSNSNGEDDPNDITKNSLTIVDEESFGNGNVKRRSSSSSIDYLENFDSKDSHSRVSKTSWKEKTSLQYPPPSDLNELYQVTLPHIRKKLRTGGLRQSGFIDRFSDVEFQNQKYDKSRSSLVLQKEQEQISNITLSSSMNINRGETGNKHDPYHPKNPIVDPTLKLFEPKPWVGAKPPDAVDQLTKSSLNKVHGELQLIINSKSQIKRSFFPYDSHKHQGNPSKIEGHLSDTVTKIPTGSSLTFKMIISNIPKDIPIFIQIHLLGPDNKILYVTEENVTKSILAATSDGHQQQDKGFSSTIAEKYFEWKSIRLKEGTHTLTARLFYYDEQKQRHFIKSLSSLSINVIR